MERLTAPDVLAALAAGALMVAGMILLQSGLERSRTSTGRAVRTIALGLLLVNAGAVIFLLALSL